MFISNYIDTILPLLRLTKKQTAFLWTEDCDRAFNALKREFIKESILTTYDLERLTRVEPDSSR